MSKFNKLTKEDMKKIIKEDESENKETKKKKIKPIVIVRSFEILIGLAYAVVLGLGRFFIPAESEFYQSFDLFSGLNPMPMVRLLSTVMLVLLVGTLLRVIILGIGRGAVKAKGKGKKRINVAVLQLFANLVKYVMAIVIICLALGALGVDTAAILGGLGILALVIGLGITSLIEDIVAGIFIIAERTFDVGDIIVVDGFRGTVVSIGVRSTKIADVGGDIRTMRNSTIGAVVNLTDRQSCAAITIPIAPDESLEKVEKIIKEGHLESIKESCDKVIGDPLYLGLCEITPKGVQMLLFIAGCKEDNRYDVERALYHGIKIMLESNGVKLGNPRMMIDEDKD